MLEAQLERAERKKATKRVREIEAELTMPPFPSALGYLWNAYIRLRRRKGAGFSGYEPIGWQDIDAFVLRSGLHLVPWEIEILEEIDDIFLRPSTEKPAAPEGQTVKFAASVTDVAGVRAVLGAVGKRRKGGATDGRYRRAEPPG